MWGIVYKRTSDGLFYVSSGSPGTSYRWFRMSHDNHERRLRPFDPTDPEAPHGVFRAFLADVPPTATVVISCGGRVHYCDVIGTSPLLVKSKSADYEWTFERPGLVMWIAGGVP